MVLQSIYLEMEESHRSTISAWESASTSWNFYRKENYEIFNKMYNALLINQTVIENHCKLWKVRSEQNRNKNLSTGSSILNNSIILMQDLDNRGNSMSVGVRRFMYSAQSVLWTKNALKNSSKKTKCETGEKLEKAERERGRKPQTSTVSRKQLSPWQKHVQIYLGRYIKKSL